ncbi:hypothetical protein BGZ73_000810, partial [Actinomortierella ambigua]
YQGRLVLVMEYADGGCLEDAIDRGQLDWPNKTRIAQEIVRGLAFIHHMNVIHRDLKSMNVLLTRYREVKLCDFGMATVKVRSTSKSTSAAKGTLRWMAPEIFAARPKYSTKSDMFALGTVMWEMAANCTTPFKDLSDNLIVVNLIRAGEREVLPDDTPQDYRQWVERCWDQDPDKRPEAKEMVVKDEEPVRDGRVRGGGSTVSITQSMSDIHRQPSTDKSIKTAIDFGGPLEGEIGVLVRRAIAGDAEALVSLAVKFEKGDGVRQSDTEAFGCYLRGAELGSAEAQFNVGRCFYDGCGTPMNPWIAVHWLKQAAKRGHAVSHIILGWMSETGYGVDKDYGKANHENKMVQTDLERLYQSGRDRHQAILWFRRSAAQGNASAQNNLGWMYQNGHGVKRDYGQAALWYHLSARQGNALAQFNIGWMYHHGHGIVQSYADAVAWYRKSADQSNASAQEMLGMMYQNGYGVKRDYSQAVLWFRKSAEQGNVSAQFNLGWMYHNGYGVERDYGQASEWLRKAANQGDEDAQHILDDMY